MQFTERLSMPVANTSSLNMNLAEAVKKKARRIGFDLVGITDASPIDPSHLELFTDWLKAGCAATMLYMHRNLKMRFNPAELLEGAQSVIVVALNYKLPETQQPPHDKTAPTGKIAHYAQYRDYHPFIKTRLRQLIDFIASLAGPAFNFKICVDSAPLAERALAQRAGLGFIGKNHMLINPSLGPQLFIGEIIINLELKPDKPIESETPCHGCDKCLKACPTGALDSHGRFDANKCISYLTIEHKDAFPADLAPKIEDRLFGCDECVKACPYYTAAPACKNKLFTFYPGRAAVNLKHVLNLTQDTFETEFTDSVIDRLGLDLLKRNARTCLENLAAI
jgi:epoxyqueuosine reductase